MVTIHRTFEQMQATPIDHDELARLRTMDDSDIDYSDMPPLTDEQISQLRRFNPILANSQSYKPIKKQITLRLDSDIIEWLKRDGKGYQTRANQLLRQLMLQSLSAEQNQYK